MNTFTYQYPTKVCFGEGVTIDSLKKELPKYGQIVLLAYGGGSIKRNGIYDVVVEALKEAGKTITEFSALCLIQRMRKFRKVPSSQKNIILILS